MKISAVLVYALRSANSLKIRKSEKNLKITAVYTRVLEYLVYIYAGSYGQIVEAVLYGGCMGYYLLEC